MAICVTRRRHKGDDTTTQTTALKRLTHTHGRRVIPINPVTRERWRALETVPWETGKAGHRVVVQEHLLSVGHLCQALAPGCCV